MVLSDELLNLVKKTAKKKEIKYQTYIRLCLEQFLEEFRGTSGQVKEFKSKFEPLPKNKRIGIRLSTQLIEAATKVATARDMGYQQMIRESLERYS